jgi:hypothetical protein
MPIQVDTPDGGVAEFPDDMPPAAIEAALRKSFAPAAAGPEGSAAGRFVEGAWKYVNPVAIAQGLYGVVRHPIDTATTAAQQMGQEWEKAGATVMQPGAGLGDYVQAAGHAVAGSLPLIGPAAAAAGEKIGAGDVAGGLGEGAGLLGGTLIPRGVQAAARGVRAAIPGAAAALDAAAASRVAEVIRPVVGANKARLGNMAEKVAPRLVKDLAKDGAPLTRDALHQQIQGKLAQAEAALDEASDARISHTYETQPLIDDLLAKRKELTSKAVIAEEQTPVSRASSLVDESGRPMTVTDRVVRPIGRDVVPAPNRPRVAVLDQAISALKRLGPVAEYEPIRQIRQAYDSQAKVIYSPSMTADFLKVRGKALGAADVTGALREHLAKWDPETAAANADYSLYRVADDVLKATAEVERARPKVGRQIIARMAGTILGAREAGVAGGAAGFVLGPALDSALNAGFTTKLVVAKMASRLADAIRKGDVGTVYDVTHQMKRLGLTAAAASQTTPTPTQTAEAMP